MRASWLIYAIVDVILLPSGLNFPEFFFKEKPSELKCPIRRKSGLWTVLRASQRN